MTTLSIDPSATVTGYAVLSSDGRKLIAGGHLSPHKAGLSVDAIIRSVGADLSALIREHRPASIVIELPSTHWHMSRTRRVVGADGAPEKAVAPGMASNVVKYAAVAGGLYGFVLAAIPYLGHDCSLSGIAANAWTGKRNKGDRQRWIAASFRNYDPSKDKGCHVSDAVDLALWSRGTI